MNQRVHKKQKILQATSVEIGKTLVLCWEISSKLFCSLFSTSKWWGISLPFSSSSVFQVQGERIRSCDQCWCLPCRSKIFKASLLQYFNMDCAHLVSRLLLGQRKECPVTFSMWHRPDPIYSSPEAARLKRIGWVSEASFFHRVTFPYLLNKFWILPILDFANLSKLNYSHLFFYL